MAALCDTSHGNGISQRVSLFRHCHQIGYCFSARVMTIISAIKQYSMGWMICSGSLYCPRDTHPFCLSDAGTITAFITLLSHCYHTAAGRDFQAKISSPHDLNAFLYNPYRARDISNPGINKPTTSQIVTQPETKNKTKPCNQKIVTASQNKNSLTLLGIQSTYAESEFR